MSITKRKNIFWDDLKIDDKILDGMTEELKPACELIVHTLVEHADGLTEGQLRKMCKGTTWLQYKALKDLLASNKVIRDGRGVKTSPFIYKVK
jgi:hypothetical protein